MPLLIPALNQPGNEIDVYLQPDWWTEGTCIDGSKIFDLLEKETFCMHAALLWTINDSQAYVVLYGYRTKEMPPCPLYIEDTC